MDKWPPMVSKVHASGQIGTIILQGPPTFPWDFARPSMQGHSLLAWASLSKVILYKSRWELFLISAIHNRHISLFHLLYAEIFCSEAYRNFYYKVQ